MTAKKGHVIDTRRCFVCGGEKPVDSLKGPTTYGHPPYVVYHCLSQCSLILTKQCVYVSTIYDEFLTDEYTSAVSLQTKEDLNFAIRKKITRVLRS